MKVSIFNLVKKIENSFVQLPKNFLICKKQGVTLSILNFNRTVQFPSIGIPYLLYVV